MSPNHALRRIVVPLCCPPDRAICQLVCNCCSRLGVSGSGWRPDGSVSDLMRTVKARSSKCVHVTFGKLSAFAWQEGYSVFSVSRSQEDAVKRYIATQAEHHKKEEFKSELLRLLRAHGIEFDDRYVFD